MTPTQDAGHALDCEIARRVMGWVQCKAVGHGDDCCYWWRDEAHTEGWTLPAFSTEIAAAWQVIDKLDEKRFVTLERCGQRAEAAPIPDYWRCSLFPGSAVGQSPSAPHAICLAALQAVGTPRGSEEPQ